MKEGNFLDPSTIPEDLDEHLLFDLLDSEFRTRLDDLTIEDTFKTAIVKSSISTEMKVKLMNYLSEKQSATGIRILAALIFDYFKNAKEVLEKTAEEASIEDLRIAIMAQLNPSIMEYEDEQVNCLITLIIKEYIDRYYIDYPIWREFVTNIAREGIR